MAHDGTSFLSLYNFRQSEHFGTAQVETGLAKWRPFNMLRANRLPRSTMPQNFLWQTDCTLTFVQFNGGSLVSDHLKLEDLDGSTSAPRSSQMWYAIQTRVRREQMAATLLAGKGYEIFLPTYVAERPWRGRSREVDAPLFPGYLFAQFDVQKRLPILVTPGVVGVVGNGRTPTAVPHSEISAIRNLVLSGVPAEPWPYLECGQRVRIAEHALEGLEGILIGHKGGHRIVVSVTLLRRSVALEIHRSNVIPIQPEYKVSDECISEGVLDEVTA